MNFDSIDDNARIQALCRLGVLDTPPEERFDRLTRLATFAFQVPIALVSLVTGQRQWFKSRVGMEAPQMPRSDAFCAHTVAAAAPLVIADASLDPRFAANPQVTGEPHIRFYAGHPIFSSCGAAVGTLCIIDRVPRELSAAERDRLRDLAILVEHELNRDTLVTERDAAARELSELNQDMEHRIDVRTVALRESNEALKREIRQRESVEVTLRQSEERIRNIIEYSFSAFVSVDARGMIVDWNAAAETTFGWSRQEAVGRELTELIIPERFRARHRVGLSGYINSGNSSMVNKRLVLPACIRSGDEITVELTMSAYGSDEGIFFGAFMHDISERQRAEQALQQKSELFNAVLETIDIGVVACSGDGDLTLFNRAAREFHGMALELVSPHEWAAHYDLFAADGRTVLEPHDVPLFRALQGETIKDLPMVVAPEGMRQRMVLASGRPLSNAAGERLGAVVAMKDITELHESQRRLRLNEQRLRAITENLPALIGQVDKFGRFAFLNSRAARCFAKPLEQLLGRPVKAAYSDEEYAVFAPNIRDALAGKRVSFEHEVDSGGRRCYYAATYVPDTDAKGQVHGFYAVAFDITTRKQSELLQRESEERLRTITDNLPVLISYLDRDMRFQFANSRFEEWYGVAPALMIGRKVRETMGDAFYLERVDHFERCLSGETVHLESSVEQDGATRSVHTVFIPHQRDGRVLGAYVLSTDVTETRAYEARLKALADTDALTGLPNRRSYESALAGAIGRARSEQAAIALMFLDVDHFKRINDNHGHGAGDEVLKELTLRLRAAVRKTDTVCRLAGDEFTIVLEGVHSEDECARVADKIIAAMRTPFDAGGLALSVTVSIGIAWNGGALAGAARLAQCADAALYRAKADGRNRYTVASFGG